MFVSYIQKITFERFVLEMGFYCLISEYHKKCVSYMFEFHEVKLSSCIYTLAQLDSGQHRKLTFM